MLISIEIAPGVFVDVTRLLQGIYYHESPRHEKRYMVAVGHIVILGDLVAE